LNNTYGNLYIYQKNENDEKTILSIMLFFMNMFKFQYLKYVFLCGRVDL